MRKKQADPYESMIPSDEILENQVKEDKKTVSTAFILLFPALIIALLAIYYAPYLMVKAIVLALALYQFLMVKKFIDDYYKNR